MTAGNGATSVAVDAMGADFAPALAVAAVGRALAADPALWVRLSGSQAALDGPVETLTPDQRARVEILACDEAIAMTATPGEALRRGRDTSMALALREVAGGRAEAAVSAGNTGALMALSRAVIGMLPGIERPALMTSFPVRGGVARVLDLGANIGVDAERLTEFAVLGSAAASALLGRAPRVALLNIGSEANKGPDVVREAARRCRDRGIELAGFVEGHDVFAGRADVVVCDGFAGNVLLKSAEGAVSMLLEQVQARSGRWTAGPGLRGLARELRETFDPARHNGASLLGINGIVIKSHAHATTEGLAQAIALAATEVRRGMLPELERQLWSMG